MPRALEDAYLLRLFKFQKSLEEIDRMAIGRLYQAMEAMRIEQDWQTYHSDASFKERAKLATRIMALKRLANEPQSN